MKARLKSFPFHPLVKRHLKDQREKCRFGQVLGREFTPKCFFPVNAILFLLIISIYFLDRPNDINIRKFLSFQ